MHRYYQNLQFLEINETKITKYFAIRSCKPAKTEDDVAKISFQSWCWNNHAYERHWWLTDSINDLSSGMNIHIRTNCEHFDQIRDAWNEDRRWMNPCQRHLWCSELFDNQSRMTRMRGRREPRTRTGDHFLRAERRIFLRPSRRGIIHPCYSGRRKMIWWWRTTSFNTPDRWWSSGKKPRFKFRVQE